LATTSNLNLPLIPDNAVNNVKRDMNALAEAVDTSVTDKVSEVQAVANAANTAANTAESKANNAIAQLADLAQQKADANPNNARFKTGSATFTDNDTAQTFTDVFCTSSSLVTIAITSPAPPQGVWSVESSSGSFTITSTKAESADITFDYYITKAVG
jgi:hypothetical protein